MLENVGVRVRVGWDVGGGELKVDGWDVERGVYDCGKIDVVVLVGRRGENVDRRVGVRNVKDWEV